MDWWINEWMSWLINGQENGINDWLIDWLIDWLTDWLIDWLIDRYKCAIYSIVHTSIFPTVFCRKFMIPLSFSNSIEEHRAGKLKNYSIHNYKLNILLDVFLEQFVDPKSHQKSHFLAVIYYWKSYLAATVKYSVNRTRSNPLHDSSNLCRGEAIPLTKHHAFAVNDG